MKNSTLLLALLLMIGLYACKPEVVICYGPETPTCIEEKILEWKTNAYPGSAIYIVDAPSGTAWHFVRGCIDCGDYFYNENCEKICVTNLEGFDPGTTECGQEMFDAPRELYWEQQ
jgi:hypothetical protein